MAHFKVAQNTNWHSLIWDARGIRFDWVVVQYMSRLSTENYNSRATGSLRHFMLNVFCTTLKTAPISVKISITDLKQGLEEGEAAQQADITL